MAAAQYFEQVQKIFIAFYQRPADPAGLKYWAERVDAAGGDINQVINAFASSPEAVDLYGAIDATTDAAAIRTVIDKLYLALFNAADDFDAAGKQFYVDGFMAGTFTAGSIALSVLNGAQNDDLIAVNNKVQVANEFTQQVDGRPMSNAYFGNGTAFNVTYAGDADAIAARDILKGVTFLPSTVISPSQVTEALKAQIADPTDPIIGQGGGQTFTLTTGVDNIQGTAGNDTILGVADAGATSNQNTLNAADVINGGAGTDSLMATLDVGSGGVLPSAQYSNIENFFIRNVSGTAAGNTFNFANVAGEEQVWNDRSTSAVTVTGLAAGTTVGVKGANTAVAATTATYVATATEAKLALDGGLAATPAAATGAVTIAGAGLTSANITSTGGTNNIAALSLAATVTSLTVDATSAFAINDGNPFFVEGITAAGLTSITAKGAGAINLGSAAIGATVTTVNAADNTGGVTAVLSAGQTNIKFTGGSGNDVVTTNGAGGNLLTTAVVDAGAGTADRLVIAATADILNAGAPTSKARGDLYKGFEQVQVQSGQALDVELLSTNNTIDTIRINDDAAGGVTVSNLSATQAGNVTILTGASPAGGVITIGVKGAGISGQIDTVKAAVQTTTAAGAAAASDLSGITLTGVEKLDLTGSNGAIATNVGQVTLTTTAATSLDSIKLNNANAVNTNTADNNVITIAAGQTATNLVIDATGSGDTTINAGAYAPVASATSGVKIIGGAGNDIITGSNRADDITLGGGSDIVQLGANGNTAATAANAIVVDTINDFVFGVGGDVIDASNLANALQPLQNGAVSATTVTALNAALPTGGTNGTAELIVLDSSIAALQAGNAVALNALNFNLAGAANQGQVLVAYAASASGDVHLASATITGGDITNVVDLAVLKGVTTAMIGSGFVATNLIGFQTPALNLTITAGTTVTGSAQNDIFTAADSAAFSGATVIGAGGTDSIVITAPATNVTVGNGTTGGTLTGTFGTLTLQGGTVAGQTVTLDNSVANMNVVAGAASSVNLGTGAGNSFAGSAGVDTVVFSATPGAGVNLTGLNAADTVSTTATVDLSGVNTGATTGAGTLNMLTNATVATMTAAQHNGFSTITAAGGADTITLTTAATVVGNAAIETYSVVAGSTFTLGAAAQNVTETVVGNTTVNLNGLTAVGTFGAFEAGDVLRVTATGDVKGVNAGAVLGMDTLDFNNTNAVTLTLTQAQHEGLTTVNNTTNTQTLEVTTTGAVTARAGIENYNLSGAFANAITVNALTTGVNITGAAGGVKTVNIGNNTVTGTWALGNAADVIAVNNNGADITGVNGGAATTAEALTITSSGTGGNITMTTAQYAGLTGAFTAGGTADAITISTSGAHGVGNAVIETFNLNGAGSDSMTFGLADGALVATSQTVNITAGGNDTITLNNVSIDAGAKVVTINGFDVANDKVVSQLAGDATITGAVLESTAAAKLTGLVTGTAIEINTSIGQIADFTSDTQLLALLNASLTGGGVVADIANGTYTVIAYSGANAGLYQVTIAGSNGTTSGDDVVELVGLLNNVGANALTAFNLA